MPYDPKKLTALRNKSKTHYFNLSQVYCPALKANVTFNSDGFYHMLFKSNREKRTVAVQHSRLVLVPLLKPVLMKAKTIKETRVIEVKIAGVTKVQTCYALIEYVGNGHDAKVKVVVRKTGSGGYFFHSAMKLGNKKKNTQ